MPRRLAPLLAVLPIALLLLAVPARAVLVRGKVTSQLGQPLPGSRIQLIRLTGGARSVADAVAGLDGSFELRSSLAGRFLLIASPSVNAPQYAPQIGTAFYGGRADLVIHDIFLNIAGISPQTTAQATLLETPLYQLPDATAQIAADQILSRAIILPDLRPLPGAFIVQAGQSGTPATLLLRGAPVTKILVDGISAEQLGGAFNLATVTSSGLAAINPTPSIELTPGANPLHGVDAQSGVLSFSTPVASTLHPTLTYTGDAGGLSTTHHEAVFSVAHSRADAFLSFARLNTDNDLPAQRLHLVTSAANLGYHISANTSLRATLRRDVSATPGPSPFALFAVAPSTRLATQNVYGSASAESRTAGNWHNLLRYGLVRDRSQALNYSTPATGLPVTIVGVNGYTASGSATFLPAPAREDAVTNRDEATYQTDYPVARSVTALLTLGFWNERAADLSSSVYPSERLTRTHFSAAAAFQGGFRHDFFYTASGFLDRSPTYGLTGGPRLGLTFIPTLPGTRRFRGTAIHLTAATGIREPSAFESAALAQPIPSRSRTIDVSVDQDILPRKLSLRATYFHNQFSHQTETLTLLPLTLSNALAYRTQGLEAEIRYQPARRLFVEGGYTFLAALVERSASTPVFNSDFPGVPIGALTALPGARPFNRPPQTGFVTAAYTGQALTATLRATFAGRSDGSTGLLLNPTLLLPNRNLSPGYASLDASVAYAIKSSITVFTDLSNLLDDRHIAPIGYLSTPFLARAGLRIRLGRE